LDLSNNLVDEFSINNLLNLKIKLIEQCDDGSEQAQLSRSILLVKYVYTIFA